MPKDFSLTDIEKISVCGYKQKLFRFRTGVRKYTKDSLLYLVRKDQAVFQNLPTLTGVDFYVKHPRDSLAIEYCSNLISSKQVENVA